MITDSSLADGYAAQLGDYRKKADMVTHDQPGDGWTAVLRRRARMVDGRPEGGYTDAFEIICCDRGDDPGRDHCEVAPEPQQVRGPYTIKTGLAAYEAHLRQHHPAETARRPRRYPMLAEWR